MKNKSIITCPGCGYKKEETIPENTCLQIYVCSNCGENLKPKAGDCCIFCSYGSVKCVPMQVNNKPDKSSTDFLSIYKPDT